MRRKKKITKTITNEPSRPSHAGKLAVENYADPLVVFEKIFHKMVFNVGVSWKVNGSFYVPSLVFVVEATVHYYNL
jgi:hypothetical protein